MLGRILACADATLSFYEVCMEKKVLKYDPLMEYLKRERAKGLNRVALTFEQINLIIDDELPDSAKDYKAWWFGHPCQDHAWKDAGYSKVDAILDKEVAIFEV